jgi:chaperonin cofactor prefoldin
MEAQMEQFVAWLKKIDNLQDAKTVEEINKLHNDWKAAAANFGEMVERMKKRESTEMLDDQAEEVSIAMGAFEKMQKSYNAWGKFLMETWC